MGITDWLADEFGFESIADTATEVLSFGSEWTPTYNQPDEPSEEEEAEEERSNLDRAIAAEARKSGIETNPAKVNVRELFAQAGVDVDHPDVAPILDLLAQKLQDPNDTATQALLPMMAAQYAEKYPSVPSTQYDEALAVSGFGGNPFPSAVGTQGPVSHAPGLMQGTTGGPNVSSSTVAPKLETSSVGWIRYANGVLADPSSGQVYYQPGSLAPGSPWWQQKVVRSWGPDKVKEWKDRLHEYGYLTADQAKGNTTDTVFLGAIAQYHQNRYLMGGKPVVGDASVASGSGTDEPQAVNLRDFQAQIRNDVREQYRRVYGVDPSDGEVATWTSYITKKGMELQRRNIRKYDAAMTESSAAEAEELFIEKLESSPEAQYLTQANEENTRLRDTFERMAMVTGSLVN